MSYPYMSQKDVPQYGAVNFVPAQPLPVYYVTPEPPRRRYTFLKSLIVSLALLEAVWFGYHWHLRHWHRSSHGHIHGPGWDIDLDMNGIDPGAEGCAVWDHYKPDHPKSQVGKQTVTSSRRLEEGDKFTFSIATSSERYHFVSWGPIDKSRFEVVPVESDKEQVVAEVEVLKDPRGTARVCVLPSSGDDEKYGVGIYSPRDHENHGPDEWPAFSVKVFVPVSSDGSQRNLNALETRLGQFEHVIPDLSTINFTKVQLSAANVPITIKAVVANEALVHDANGPITANITSATRLVVTNANSPISADLTLIQAGNINVNNANGKIDTTVYLKAGDYHPRPDYHLSYSNANSPIQLKIAEQPVGSGFFLQGSNANGAVSAHLHAAYEGHFKVSDVLRTPTVTLTNHKDPAGEGRKRLLQFDKNGSVKEGSIEWSGSDSAEHAPGEVKLSSVLAPVDLYFD